MIAAERAVTGGDDGTDPGTHLILLCWYGFNCEAYRQ